MFKYGGYAGRLLRVDLGRGTTKIEPLPEQLAEQYLGGNGFGARILYDEVPVCLASRKYTIRQPKSA
jgi:aldehyde:ferredoxin oxidoreductase